jgi:hypothetical protein
MHIQTQPGVFKHLTAIEYARSIHRSMTLEIAKHCTARSWRSMDVEAVRFWEAAAFWLRRRHQTKEKNHAHERPHQDRV